MPSHNHAFLGAATGGTEINAGGNLMANSPIIKPFVNIGPDANMNANAISPVGGSQPHTNIQPYLCISFIISLFGIFPSPT
jgi:microcystin-dependent protein